MGVTTVVAAPREQAELTVPFCWQPPRRDVALDVLRGLAMVILVINHLPIESVLESITRAVLSAAEVLVAVSGVVGGMVFGRRWVVVGRRATTRMLLARSRKLYVASVIVVGLIGIATLVPGLATDPLAISPNTQRPIDTYAADDLPDALLAIVTLEAGPWQFNILGFFIAMLALTPLLLAALERGWWPAVLAGSVGVYLLGRALQVDLLPSQSERAFPILVWQVLFVPGIVLGWHRARLQAVLAARSRAVVGAVVAVATAAAALQLAATYGPPAFAAWEEAHFEKTYLDVARILGMTSLAAAFYCGVRAAGPRMRQILETTLAPLGSHSFYVFIMHVFLCLAVATLLPGEGLGPVGNAVVQAACLVTLWVMVRRRFLFRWVPR
jgi:hypothetical protein